MRAKVAVTRDTLSPRLRKIAEGLQGSGRRRVLGTMAKEYARIARANFGPKGLDRPSEWRKLSDKYRRWKRQIYGSGEADLLLEHRLRDSIRSEVVNDNFSEVIAGEGLAYANRHQEGTSGMPQRPFFPQRSPTEATPYTMRRLKEVAEEELSRLTEG